MKLTPQFIKSWWVSGQSEATTDDTNDDVSLLFQHSVEAFWSPSPTIPHSRPFLYILPLFQPLYVQHGIGMGQVNARRVSLQTLMKGCSEWPPPRHFLHEGGWKKVEIHAGTSWVLCVTFKTSAYASLCTGFEFQSYKNINKLHQNILYT